MGGGGEGTVHSNTSPRRPRLEGRPRGPGTPRPGVHRPSTSQPVQLKPPFPKRGRDLPEVTQQAQGDAEPEPGCGPHPKPRKDTRRLPGASAAPSADPHTPTSSAGDTKGPGPGERRPGGVGEAAHTAPARGSPWAYWACASPGTRQMPLSEGRSARTGPATAANRPPLVLLC